MYYSALIDRVRASRRHLLSALERLSMYGKTITILASICTHMRLRIHIDNHDDTNRRSSMQSTRCLLQMELCHICKCIVLHSPLFTQMSFIVCVGTIVYKSRRLSIHDWIDSCHRRHHPILISVWRRIGSRHRKCTLAHSLLYILIVDVHMVDVDRVRDRCASSLANEEYCSR